jgi:carbamoyltransferase
MYILGLNAYHGDASAAILKDGVLIAATEEERIRRVKHWAGLPTEAISFCLKEAGITLKEVDYITVGRNPYSKIELKAWRAIKGIFTGNKSLNARVQSSLKIKSVKAEIAKAFGFEEKEIKAELKLIEHHRAHLASAYFVSPFESSALLSIDGFGDFTSSMRAEANGLDVKIIDSVSYPHSIGVFYTAFTQLLGFNNYGDEYKVMGLAPYGTPNMVKALEEVVVLKSNGLFELNEKYFRHVKEGVQMAWEDGSPEIGDLFTEEMAKQFGAKRQKDEPLSQYHMDLASSVQKMCENTIFHMAEDLYKRTGNKNLCIAGGVAQNSVANGKILENTSFENLFVPPAGHDAGLALGSALWFFHHDLKKGRLPFKHQAYTGAHFTNDEIETILKERNITYSRLSDTDLIETVAQALADAKVIGWFQGRAEFGPRALGNRSILVDPSRLDAKDLLNSKIKRRESFRPFAPSILSDFASEFFEKHDSVPFMEKVYRVKKEKRSVIPAVTHADGTGRLQTVTKTDNPRYYELIDSFRKKTGIPLLLNTSFNENEPIVNNPTHALDCYLRTQMDMLVLENIIIRRN